MWRSLVQFFFIRWFDSFGKLTKVLIEDFGSDVLDAGTEVNDESRVNTAFFGQMTPDTGVDENGVVNPHPGFLPEGSGGILDDPNFENVSQVFPVFILIFLVRKKTWNKKKIQ